MRQQVKAAAIAGAAALLLGVAAATRAHAQAPVAQAPPAEDAAVPVQIGTTFSIASQVLGQARRITIRVPYGYDAKETEARAFPVVYLIDGGPEQDYPHLAGIAQLSDTNPAFGEFILVGVETVNRRAEISPPVKDVEKYKDFGAVPGGSAKFRAFLRREVKPWVEGRYRTSGRDVLIGESLAGLFTAESFLREPELFDDYVAVSPSLWWEEMELGRRAPELLKAHRQSERTLRIYIADEGYWQEEGALKLVAALEKAAPAGLRWGFFDLGDEETHKTIFHRAAFDAIRDLFALPDRTYRPHPAMSGIAITPRTTEMEARAAKACSAANSRRTTPADTRRRRDETFYECVLYDYGDRPSRGNLGR